MLKIILVAIVLFSAVSYADVSGNLSLSVQNTSIDTGILGNTVEFCNSDADCQEYKCFLDYDGVGKSGSGFAGWCNVTYFTNCYHNEAAYSDGTTICVSTTDYRTCQSHLWSNQTSCGDGEVCSGGGCVSNTTTTASSSSSGSSSTQNPKIEIIKFPADFSAVQGSSTIKILQANNTGDVTLKNTTLSVTGVPSGWYSITPNKDNFTSLKEVVEFTINFTIPSSAEVKGHLVVFTVSAENPSASASKSITITVLPSQETVQSDILPRQEDLFSRATVLEKSLEDARSQISQESYDSIKNLLENAKRKIVAAQGYIDGEDYVAAVESQNDAGSLLDNVEVEIAEALKRGQGFPILFVVAGVLVVAVIGAVFYIRLPSKESGFLPGKGWITPSEKVRENRLKKFLEKLRTKKKSDFRYEFKK